MIRQCVGWLWSGVGEKLFRRNCDGCVLIQTIIYVYSESRLNLKSSRMFYQRHSAEKKTTTKKEWIFLYCRFQFGTMELSFVSFIVVRLNSESRLAISAHTRFNNKTHTWRFHLFAFTFYWPMACVMNVKRAWRCAIYIRSSRLPLSLAQAHQRDTECVRPLL